MWRHQAVCRRCGSASAWQGDPEPGEQEIIRHLRLAHQAADPVEGVDYRVDWARQCDYCLGAYLDHCTKCDRDFCRLHEGDIDGLCGYCI